MSCKSISVYEQSRLETPAPMSGSILQEASSPSKHEAQMGGKHPTEVTPKTGQSSLVHVKTDLLAGTGGGGGFFAREGGGGGGALFLLVNGVKSLPCEVAGDTDCSP